MTKTDTTHLFAVGAFVAALVCVALFTAPSLASAHNGLSGKNHHASSTKPHASTTVNLTCMQTAVDTREASVGTAFNTLHTAVAAALAARKTALHDAWGLTDKVARNKAIKTAWMKWKVDNKAAHTKLRIDRKKAWETFTGTVKNTCKETLPKEESLEKDSSGQISL